MLVLCIAFLSVAVARCCSLVDRCRWCCVLVSVGVDVRCCNGLIGFAGAVYWQVLLLLCAGALG